jgi:tetratricopeptide (TPR) repeat protein
MNKTNTVAKVFTGETLTLGLQASHLATLSAGKELALLVAGESSRTGLKSLMIGIEAALPQASSGVTFALERRISRENVSLALQLEKLALWIREHLNRLVEIRTLVIPNLECYDDISLKMLARVIPFVGKRWILQCSSSVDADKARLIQRFSASVKHLIAVAPSAYKAQLNPLDHIASPLDFLRRELVLTNYSACLTLGRKLLSSPGTSATDRAEILKISALALLNRGLTEDALELLRQSEEVAPKLTRKAHIACLTSLLSQKRMYNTTSTLQHIERGLQYVDEDASRGDDPEEVSLERAWLLNSLALTHAIQYRKRGDVSAANQALRSVQKAFDLSRPLKSPSAMYLRFNLAANSVFMLEMLGLYARALETLEQSFSHTLSSGNFDDSDGAEAFHYRRAVLIAKARDKGEAVSILKKLVPAYMDKKAWFLAERVLRAMTFFSVELGRFEEARAFAEEGLGICESSRSVAGAAAHTQNLFKIRQIMLNGGDQSEKSVEFVDPGETTSSRASSIPKAPPKLPAYIPELDLEETPKVDLNNFLVGNVGGLDSCGHQ